MADFQVKLTGVDELVKNMRALPVELRKKPARSALGKAAKLIRERAKANALAADDPETGRAIADNIVQRFRSKYQKQTGDVMISIGVNTEKGRIPDGNPDTGRGGSTPHWHLIELGTEKNPAQPFLRPAASEMAGAALNTFSVELGKALDRMTKKARTK